MSLLHAAFSGGAMVGALGAGVLIQAGVDYRIVYLVLLVPLAAVILDVATTRFPVVSGEVADGVSGEQGYGLTRRLPLLVVCGFLVVGLALPGVAPIAFSAAGDLAPGRAGGAISVVTTLGYGGFLLGPVVVGGLAELLGLRVALGTIAAAGAMIFVLGLRLKTD
jgi:hypothetical protein